ncbi:hypothetical protein BDZ97DRAFT_1784583 [Flammula alnicola]|nr:hypothetical protein BDZ97DRAFT_1784583 [Flammula alnicola]
MIQDDIDASHLQNKDVQVSSDTDPNARQDEGPHATPQTGNLNADPLKDDSSQNSRSQPKPWTSEDESFHYPIPKPDRNPWEVCNDFVQRYDKDMCQVWTEEIQYLLIFAGLFSAVVTTFAVESLKSLQQDPTVTSACLLAQISSQLSNTTTQNIDTSSLGCPNAAFRPSRTAVRVNILWFTSLGVSLATVVVGILFLQWLRSYQRDANTSLKQSIILRHIRHEGLLGWSLFIFLILTTVLPTMQCIFTSQRWLHVPQCPFKSPQSWLFHQMIAFLGRLVVDRFKNRCFQSDGPSANNFWKSPYWKAQTLSRLFNAEDWVSYDKAWDDIRETFQQNIKAIEAVYHCLRDLSPLETLKTFTKLYPKDPKGWRDLFWDLLCSYALKTLLIHPDSDDDLLAAWSSDMAFNLIETYVRIKNSVSMRCDVGFLRRTIPYETNMYPPDLKVQLLLCMKKSILQGDLSDDPVAFIGALAADIFEMIMLVPNYQGNPSVMAQYTNMHTLLEQWLTDSPDNRREERLACCIQYLCGVQRFFDDDSLDSDHAQILELVPNFFNTHRTLVEATNALLQRFGFPQENKFYAWQVEEDVQHWRAEWSSVISQSQKPSFNVIPA